MLEPSDVKLIQECSGKYGIVQKGQNQNFGQQMFLCSATATVCLDVWNL